MMELQIAILRTWRHAGEHGTRSSVVAEDGLYLVCVADIAHTFVPTAAGAHRLRSASVRHEFHHDAAVHALLLERPTVAKTCLPALKYATHAHVQRVSGTGAVERTGTAKTRHAALSCRHD